MEDNEIIKLYWERNENAIQATAEKYAAYCRSIARGILGDTGDADECLNDLYLRAWQAIPPALPERLPAFLGKITRNLALNVYEKRHADKRNHGRTAAALSELSECVPDKNSSLENRTDQTEITEAINRFLAELSAPHRKIFVRRYWYLSGIDDIARDYALSAGTVKSVLSRTRKKLRQFLLKEGVAL